jgi:cell division inhibitor SepF
MSFINAVKNFIGIETEEEYYDDEYYDEENELEEEEPQAKRTSTFSRKNTSKVVPINPGATSRIRIMKPSEFDDSTGIADEIKGGRLVIFDVGNLDATEARRVVDFVSGAAYGVNGNVRRVSGGIFVAAPRNIDITGDNLKEHTRNTFDWNV